jgi:DNA-binding IclR family transcriptional regulator
MTAALQRTLLVLERLAAQPEGCTVSALAQALDLPLSATHRVLGELCEHGYARQLHEQGAYVLTMKLVSLGLAFLGASGVVDVAQPLLDELAVASGELVRLAVLDQQSLVFVAKAQGATRGLRYDPDMGLSVRLSCSAAGHAYLATLSDADALAIVHQQGFGQPADYGPRAPTTDKALLTHLKRTRQQGFSTIIEVFAPGMTAMSAAVRGPGQRVLGVVTIAGPMFRLTEERMQALGPQLIDTANTLGRASVASGFFQRVA